MAICVFGAGLLLWVLYKGSEVIKGRAIGQEVKKESGDCTKHSLDQTVFNKRHKPFVFSIFLRISQK